MPAHSKDELQCKLQDPRILRGQNLAELRAVAGRNHRACPEAVGQVERLTAGFHAHGFADPENARESSVDLPKARTGNARPAGVAKRPKSRLLECCRVYPAGRPRI